MEELKYYYLYVFMSCDSKQVVSNLYFHIYLECINLILIDCYETFFSFPER